MSMSRQPQVLLPPTNTGMWAGFDPDILGQVDWPGAPAVSLAIDRIVRDALATGLTLRETYQQVRITLIAQGVQPDKIDLERCVKDHALGVI
jgi:hypothetical protein